MSKGIDRVSVKQKFKIEQVREKSTFLSRERCWLATFKELEGI